jgi:branched-chain amino acid transport system substrate-binding protein
MKKGFLMWASVICFSVGLLLLVVGSVQAASDETIKIGSTEPLSGTFKDIGERYLEGVQYAAKVINESGGLLGKKVEVIPIDSEMKPDVATRKATNLILRDGVKFFCGGSGSSVGAAMAQLAEKENVIMFSYGMAAASMTGEKCSKNFFRACGNTDQHSFALAQWVAKKGYKRVAMIAQDYSFGKEATEAFKKKLSALNPSVNYVAEIYHPTATKDYAPYVSQLISAKPDVVFTPNWGNDLTLLLKQGRPMGLKARFAVYYVNDDVMIKALGNDSFIIGDVGVEVYMLSIPSKKNQEFIDKFHKEKGYYPSWLRGKSYTATMFWAEAVKKAGTTDVNTVIKAWEGLSYDGPAGVWTMRECDHQAQMPFWAAEIVIKNKFYKHAYIGAATMIPAKDVSVPCNETGCKMNK